jgi:ABC-type transporter Mla MlaB component
MPDHIDFENLVAIRTDGERYIESEPDPVFDLGSLVNSSSAAVAVLIAWYRHAHSLGKKVRFANVPAGVMNIIEVSDLTDVLPVEEPA